MGTKVLTARRIWSNAENQRQMSDNRHLGKIRVSNNKGKMNVHRRERLKISYIANRDIDEEVICTARQNMDLYCETKAWSCKESKNKQNNVWTPLSRT